ncbi:hypothetical protein LTR53_011809 [Teratosphaeriaceae sp. CCFEE 6253]|nr:hypothetical protein LTR53_011809 [Teratosphaeriaceae sp. CCFEE 6253]
MAEAPFFSSQGSSNYDRHHVLLSDQENLASSPPASSPLASHCHDLKPRALPTVTPKRFTKFFTPRASLRTRSGRPSKAGRQLRDITRSGANGTRPTLPRRDDMLQDLKSDEVDGRPAKRGRWATDLDSEAPQSSPLKHVQAVGEIQIPADEPASPTTSDLDDLPDLLEDLRPFPQPIRRLRTTAPSRHILDRSFGGYSALTRGHRGATHCADPRSTTANFVSTPADIHSFRPGTAIPFCTAPCHTNSLVVLGDEAGHVRLVDTAPTSDFATAHLTLRPHSNAIMDLAFSSTDALLATASGDQTTRITDMATQRVLCVLSGHLYSVKQVRFQPHTNDHVLTTSSRDGSVKVWDLRCAERGAVQSLRVGQRRGLDPADASERTQPSVRYPRHHLPAGPSHRASKSHHGPGVRTPQPQPHGEDAGAVSITALAHLPGARAHCLLTASEVNASIQLWDLRHAGRRSPVPVARTPVPDSHTRTRHYGISSLALSGDGARLYSLCRDATIYAYSTNHLLLGQAPEFLPSDDGRRRAARETKMALGPLYGLRHAGLTTGSFYVKLAVRPSGAAGGELLAVGSGTGTPVVFPTEERDLHHFPPHSTSTRDGEDGEHDPDQDDDLPTLATSTARSSARAAPAMEAGGLSIHTRAGTPLVRGHTREVTSLCWSHDGGGLVTVSDDFTARCWRDGEGEKAGIRGGSASNLRTGGEGEGRRWGCGWADVDGGGEWDDEDG